MRGSMRSLSLLSLALLAMAPAGAQRRGFGGPAIPENLAFRFVGPAVGNRIAAVAGVPGDNSTYYVGAASGGVWKTTDGGARWAPIFDSQSAQAIGALALSVTDHKIVWAGTGEAWVIRDSDMMGNGVYKSTDAGATWQHMGLEETGRIGRIIVHPTNPEIVYACAVGRATGPQQERGVFRTRDGGKTWDRVLFADPDTGCSGLTMDANDPNTLFAGMWQVVLHTYAMFSGGPSSAVYMTHDGGNNWQKLGEANGLPHSPVGKIDVAVAPRNSKRVYALIQTADQGSVWRSDDGGDHWTHGSWQRELVGRAGYYIRLAVSPANPDEVLVADSSFWRSTDGGKSFVSVPWGGDTHDIWYDPMNADRICVTHDGGMWYSLDHGRTSQRLSLPIGQMYHVAVDNDDPYHVYSNMQDDGTMRGANNVVESGPNVPGQDAAGGRGGGGGFGRGGGGGTWEHNLGGCESGFTIPDPSNSDIVWASCYGDEVTRFDARSKLARSVSPYFHTLDSAPNQTKYRCHWTAPLAVDPFDPKAVYFGCQLVFRTTNAGMSWTEISEDLSTRDPSRVISSGGIVGDNLGQFYGEVVFAIAPSEIQRGLVWAGTNDGQVWYTKDGGGHWNNVTKNISGLPAWGTVTSIEPSHFEAGTAYVSIDFHLMDNRDPYIYKTTDFGQSWTQISSDLPKNELSYVRVVAEDPNCKGLLFVGTGNDLYYSSDDGAHWKVLDDGLPHATVSWAVVQKQFHDLVVSTYGRGLYILDDITPLEQMAKDHSDAAVRFFAPRATYRFVRGGRAILDYSLKSATKEPVDIEVLDEHNNVIRKLKAPGKAGVNRTAWDLRYEPPHVIALRTAAPDNPHIWEEPRFRGKDSRPVTHWGIEGAQVGPIVAPGKYTLRLTVNGQTFTQPLTILKDPHAPSSDADIDASVKTLLRIRDDITHTSDMVNRIEWMRKQLEDVNAMLADQKSKADLRKSVQQMDQKMQSVEFKLLAREQANSDDKYYTDAYKVYLNLIWLNGEVGTGAGDVAGGADFAPTPASLEVLQNIEKNLSEATADYQNLMTQQLPAFDRTLTQQGITPLTAAMPPVAAASSATR